MALPKGVTMHGTASVDSALVQHVRKAMVKALVMREIQCPRTREVLDVRTCVVLVDTDGDPVYVLSQKGWAEIVTEGGDALLEKTHGLTVDPATVKGA